MRKTIVLLACVFSAHALFAQVLSTEVWVGRLDASDSRFEVSGLTNVSNHPGYDNQPAFFSDGQSFLFASEESGLDDTGLGVHAVRHDLRTGRNTPIAKARGFSPTPTPDGKGLTTLREGRVRAYDLAGRDRGALTETTTVGYYTRFDRGQWALFLNEKDRRIVMYDDATKQLETMDSLAVTAPYRVPGERAVTYVVDGRVLRKLDLDAKKATTLATIPFPTGGHHVWTPRGTLLIASGAEIHEWNPAHPADWPVVFRATDPDLQGITRIAISPAFDRIALVSTVRPETIVRETRAASNRPFRGAYVRTISELVRDGDKLIERGSIAEGALRRDYEVMWAVETGENGVPGVRVVGERY